MDRMEPEKVPNGLVEKTPQGNKEVLAKNSFGYSKEAFTKDVKHYKIVGAKDPFEFYMVKETSENGDVFTDTEKFHQLQELMRKKDCSQNVSNFSRT